MERILWDIEDILWDIDGILWDIVGVLDIWRWWNTELILNITRYWGYLARIFETDRDEERVK